MSSAAVFALRLRAAAGPGKPRRPGNDGLHGERRTRRAQDGPVDGMAASLRRTAGVIAALLGGLGNEASGARCKQDEALARPRGACDVR